MHITHWGEYSVHFAIHLARAESLGNSPVSASECADAVGIDVGYAQKILQRLRVGDVVKSIRGPAGGYALSRPAERITLRDILIAAEGSDFEVICDTKPLDETRCAENVPCAVRDLWRDLRDHINIFLIRTTLSELIAHPPKSPEVVQIGASSSSR